MIGWLFKLALVTLAAGFLWVFHTDSENGRYQPMGQDLGPDPTFMVLDTREGVVFWDIRMQEQWMFDLQSGQVQQRELSIVSP